MNRKVKTALEIFLIIALFLLVSYLVQKNIESFKEVILKHKILGIIVYAFLEVITSIIAPLTTIPLIPLLSAIYGWFIAGVIVYISWFIGAIIVFYISRRFGKPFVKRFMSLKEIESIEKSISKKRKIWALIVLLMTIPSDLLSYAIGLFSSISWKNYVIASLIGFIPLSFALAYLGSLPFLYQLVGSLIFAVIIISVIIFGVTNKREKKHKKHSSKIQKKN